MRALRCGILLLAATGSGALAPAEERVVTVAPRYQKGPLHRAMLGSGYRALWATPVTVEVLDLGVEAGGLHPTRRVGGQQTRGLALAGANGRSYTFRALDKDPTGILPEEFQGTFVEGLVQDQMAAQHPGGALVADGLMEAAGVPHADSRLVVLPDDERLGDFRRDFAGTVGTFGEYPTPASARAPGFHGATEILAHDEMYARLARSPEERPDVRALLRARLLDMLIGDFDRHRKQWRWARVPESPLWQPIPEDRDQAFSRYGGLLIAVTRDYTRILQEFGPRYERLSGLTYNGREQDRWLLTRLDRGDFQAAAAEVQARLTDEALQRAVDRLPAEWRAKDGARLLAALKARRDALPQQAIRYYLHLAGEVDVQATELAERVEALREPEGALHVTVRPLAADGKPGEPSFERRFLPGETREVRLYLRGGDDHVAVAGGGGPIRLRVVGGDGRDVVDDRQGGGTRVYDAPGVEVQPGPGTVADLRPYTAPPGPKAAPWIAPRDWGRDWYQAPALGFGSDIGFFAGFSLTTQGYGFRRHPWSDQQHLQVGWAFGVGEPRLRYEGQRRRLNSRALLGLDAGYSGLEVLRFYGFGNRTSAAGDDDFFEVRQRQLWLQPTFELPVDDRFSLKLGPALRLSDTEEGTRLVDLQRPYGSGRFGQLGATATLRYDARRGLHEGSTLGLRLHGGSPAGGYPVRGGLVELQGAVFPAVWDVEEAFGWVDGSAAAYLSPGTGKRVTLALRGGGRRAFGRYPFHEAARLGAGGDLGGDLLRGFRPDRFSGDGSLYGNADVRLYLSRFFLALPGEWGVHGFGDVGRVFLAGESSDTWHTSFGGGLWFSLLSRGNALSLAVARSEERTAFTVRAGFSF